MNRIPRFAPLSLLALAALLVAGCHGNQNQNAANTSQPAASDQSQSDASDPASANLAPISTDTSMASTQQGAPPPDSGSYYQQVADQAPDDDDSDYGEQPEYTAPDPPPALPDYDQPPDPGDGYIWTPGYWNYASTGYYWVPGVWVQAPYEGALWTPGYWGFVGGHYGFFHGYWGPHIGFYGGVNYGFGYGGTGYQGGYWNSGHFFYNRAVNNINATVVHNVYSHPVPANNVRISFHGGQGGIKVRPRPAELAALRDPHAAPMHAQIENQHAASINRAQFASVNHGRPASMVVEKPIMADHGVHPVAAPMPHNLPKPHAQAEMHPNAAHPEAGHPEAVRPVPARPESPRPEAAPHAQPHPEQRPAPPAAHPESRPEQRPAPHPAEHPAPRPAEHPAQHPAEHPAPPPHHPESKAAPKPKPSPEKPL
jgi:hypothetical protein